ncbi:hypothetical protein [Sphingomonas fennica]|uniref:hypothetical protein n=1 Tax=Edaphosphingomonas fennica TaxID=114404 RepID=UPI0014748A0A|nr:hypothetical protein [Sphingomonas fennica]
MDDFYAARIRTIPPLPWTNFAPPLSLFMAISANYQEQQGRESREVADALR